MGSEDQRKIAEMSARLEQELDATPPRDRAKLVERLRGMLLATGDNLTSMDETALDHFSKGAIGIGALQNHFGERFTNVLLRAQSNGDV